MGPHLDRHGSGRGPGDARLLGSKKLSVASEDVEPTGLSRILFNKWYVDEFYHRWVVDPVLTTSRVLWRIVDTRIIDGTVNLVGDAARAIVGWGACCRPVR